MNPLESKGHGRLWITVSLHIILSGLRRLYLSVENCTTPKKQCGGTGLGVEMFNLKPMKHTNAVLKARCRGPRYG